MKVSAIPQISDENCKPRRNLFIQLSNSFMSNPSIEDPAEKANFLSQNKHKKMGIENLEEFTVFPKEIIDGKTVITA